MTVLWSILVLSASCIQYNHGKRNDGWGWFYEQSFKEFGPNYSSEFLNTTLQSLSHKNISGASSKDRKVLDEYITQGVQMAAAASNHGEQLAYSGITLTNCPRSHMLFFSPAISSVTIAASHRSSAILAATKLMMNDAIKDSRVTPNTFLSFLESFRTCEVSSTPASRRKCTASLHRSIDGACNNQKNPERGQSNAPYARLIKPRYADGLFSMPLSVTGDELPNPRLISTQIYPNRPKTTSGISYLGMQWGQFITHDMASLIMETTEAGGGIMCCKSDFSGTLPPELQHHACIPFDIPRNDPFYSRLGIRCMNFVRSTTAPRDDCSLGPAEQLNAVTSYLDGSPVYGSNAEIAARLRVWRGGRLRTGPKRRLPRNPDSHKVCDFATGSHECYIAGDVRVNQSPPLTLVQTLMLREHNRLATELSRINPHWQDPTIYQTARAILVAQIQHITYYHWLPMVLGWKYVVESGITPMTSFTRDYNENISSATLNEFSTAAFRFLHSQIPQEIHSISRHGNLTTTRLSNTFFNPNLMDTGTDGFDCLLRGICSQPAHKTGHYYVEDVANKLFRSNHLWGFDLVSFDIQRGRDHGIASYNDYRTVCGLKRAKSFHDLSKEISPKNIASLQSIYKHVDDVDLFVGGSLENQVRESLLGPTFQCIIGEQFYRTRRGDRFFYCLGGQKHSFTEEQLRELKKASIARLIIDNADDIDKIQRQPFEIISERNPLLKSNEMPSINLTYWKEYF